MGSHTLTEVMKLRLNAEAAALTARNAATGKNLARVEKVAALSASEEESRAGILSLFL